MKPLNTIAVLTLSLFCLGSAAFAKDAVVIIVNAANAHSLSQEDIKSLYSDQLITWSNGDTIRLLELPTRSPVREVFAQRVLGLSALQSHKMWQDKKGLGGARALPKIKRETFIVSEVARSVDAIGYVSQKAAEGQRGIRVIMTLQ